MVNVSEHHARNNEKAESRVGEASDLSKGLPNQPNSKRIVQDPEFQNQFRKLWLHATDDNYLTLFGFRRFRTAHLLNIRFLEEEIDTIDHQIFQAGLDLGNQPRSIDRLGLQHGKRDSIMKKANTLVDKELVLRLRDLLKQYGLYKFYMNKL